jgi:transcriptional regulator with PAS, ATPase and Fis domain
VPDTLLEAEFFGVAPGAYTGADRKGRDGKFRLADGGTLFLDEIGDMPLALQAKLLRVLQEQELEPLGSNQVLKVDVRVIAATSRDLAAMVADGRFRADLYYRLNVLPIRLPALRERLADIEALADALLDDIARRSGLAARSLSADALDRLAGHDWPGNIRELRNVLEQAALMTDEPVLVADDIAQALGLPLARSGAAPAVPASAALPPRGERPAAGLQPGIPPKAGAQGPAVAIQPLPQAVAELEARAIRQALAATRGNKLAAARLLGIARATLYEKLGVLGIDGTASVPIAVD